jgi:FKBP-type peptidyl-prolyl cis-trans isomerase FkpA
MRKLLALFILPVFFLGCKNQQNIDQQTIENYISSHHLNAIAEPSGLYYVPISPGAGGTAANASQVTVTYKGYLTNDSVFDASTAPFTIALSDAIPGWQEGLPLMQRGGEALLIIPSALGYGTQPQNQVQGYSTGVPANSVLIFDIRLLAFQ